jgi:transposase
VTTGFLLAKTPSEPTDKRSGSGSEAYRELIELELSRGRNAMGIFQDLVDTHGFTGGYQSVKRFVRKLRGSVSPEARVIIETKLGEEAQVDYGTGPMVRDPDTGKYRRTRLFVMTLGSSRKCVRLLAFRSSARVWAELHEKAFRRLGGSPRIVVLDNLREGVLSADFYDPGLNPLYRDVLAHYGVTALPCKVRDPDRKGKVESGVAHAQKTPLKGKKFESLEEAQAYLDHWEEQWADKRIMAAPSGRWRRCSLRRSPFCKLCRWSRSVTTSMASARCIWTAVLRWKRPITERRQAGSGVRCMCSGTRCSCVCLIPRPVSCCASI